MADVTARLPYALSKRLASYTSNALARNGREIHYAIAGIPFRTAVNRELPLSISTAPVQKDQQDNEPEAGEQTLSGWWMRSQASFHEGAGARFAESRGEVRETARFWESANIDVWTAGEVQLLRAAKEVADDTVRSVSAIPDAAANSVVVGCSGSVKRYTNLDAGTATTNLYTGAGVEFTNVVATEVYWFAAGNDGRVYAASVSSSTTTPRTWSLTGADVNKPTRLLWAKHRLWAINANRVYTVDFATPGTPTTPAATSELYHHPSDSWEYTDLCDAPGGVLLSGHGDGSSGLQKVGLEADDAVPRLSGAQVTAVLPSDEKALRIASIASSLVCILTNRGVRVAVVGQQEAVYGPLFMARENELSGTAKPSMRAAGRFWWLCWGDEAKMWRIDSSIEVEEGVFAYASDMEVGASPFEDAAIRNERPIAVTTGGDLVYRHATELEAIGSMETGRIRYRTDEPKMFQFIDVVASPIAGSLSITMVNSQGSEVPIITYNVEGQGELASAQVPVGTETQRFISVKLTLQRSAGTTSGTTVFGTTVRALPATKPQWIYQLPLMCYDREKWSTGQQEGYDGCSADRFNALRDAVDAGGAVSLVDYTGATPTSELCKVDDVKYIETEQPDSTNLDGSRGGILVVTLRTLT